MNKMIRVGVLLLSVLGGTFAQAQLLTNGDFEMPSILGSGQTEVTSGGSKLIQTKAADSQYSQAISGISDWTYALSQNTTGFSDHGISRNTQAFGLPAGGRMCFINTWNRMLSQTRTVAIAPGDTIQAEIQFGTLGSDTDNGRAGRFYLVAGEANPANKDNFSTRSIILRELKVANPTWKQFVPDVVVPNRQMTNLTLSYTFTPNDRALGLPITVAFRTVSSSVGMTYWDNAVLTLVSTNVIPPLSATNVISGDLDQDGLPDYWEQRYTDLSLPQPGDSRSWALSPESDNDHDGVLNWDEYHHGTDPTDATDYFRLEGVTGMPNGDVMITWHSIKGQDHWVYRSNSVGPDAAWTLAGGPFNTTNAILHYTDSAGTSARFYRISTIRRDSDYWPNEASKANSDDWLVQNHSRIVEMRPRVLVLNFMNNWNSAQARLKALVSAMRWSSRYHYYDDPSAPAFLKYEVTKLVDLRDPAGIKPNDNSTKYPWSTRFEYERLYSEEFAAYYGYPDPEATNRFLTLSELVNRGVIHELWFFAYHKSYGAPFETIELKQYYDGNLKKRPGIYGPAGNGHDSHMPWINRSFRITFINGERGIGCATENFGHAFEGMANYNFCPYFKTYFDEFAGFNLSQKYGTPFNSFYAYAYGAQDSNEYPAPDQLTWHYGGSTGTVNNYIASAGNVHFMPTGRSHYDLTSTYTVLSTIEHSFMRDGPDGQDLAEPWSAAKFSSYAGLADDCMGPWLIYWRQSMPGLHNRCTDAQGKPMPNWWVFLFY